MPGATHVNTAYCCKFVQIVGANAAAAARNWRLLSGRGEGNGTTDSRGEGR